MITVLGGKESLFIFKGLDTGFFKHLNFYYLSKIF